MAKAILLKEARNRKPLLPGDGTTFLKASRTALNGVQTPSTRFGLFQVSLWRKNPRQTAALFERFDQGEEALKEYILLLKLDQSNPEYYFKAGFYFEERGKG